MKIVARKLRQNLAILFAAAVCALVVFYIVKNPNLFQASILSLEEKAFMNEKKRDSAYKVTSGYFEIFVAEKYKYSMQSFQGIIYIDPENVELDIQNLTGQGTFQITQTAKDSLLVSISNLGDIDTSREIIGIPFSGEQTYILL